MVIRHRRYGLDSAPRDERGAALILALVFLVAIAFLFVVLASSASSNELNSSNLGAQRSSEFAATGAANMAIQTARYSGKTYATSSDCMPNGGSVVINGKKAFADCSQQAYDPVSGVTRVVNVYACLVSGLIGEGNATCNSSNALVYAQVTFDDFDTSNVRSCDPVMNVLSSCGSSMTVNSWVNGAANN